MRPPTGRRQGVSAVRIVVLGGAGIIGRAIGRDLASDRAVRELVVADLDLEGARKAAASFGRPGVTAVRIDVTDHAALVRLLEGAGAVVNAVQYTFNLAVMAACLDARVPYVDLGGLFHTTRRQLELDARFKSAGVLAVLGLGSCPGVANVQARVLADRGTLRTTTTTYDAAGRVLETSVTGLGTAVPTKRNVYDPVSGQTLRTQSVSGGTVTAEVVRTYDTLGRLHGLIVLLPLFDDRAVADSMVRLCERFGRYGMYSQENTESEIGAGLTQRHDAVMNYLRSGGRHGRHDPPAVLAARTNYFREEYAYGTEPLIDGIPTFKALVADLQRAENNFRAQIISEADVEKARTTVATSSHDSSSAYHSVTFRKMSSAGRAGSFMLQVRTQGA